MDTKIDPTSYKPLYLQISEILRSQIKNGKYKAGDLLPSGKTLMEEYSVSRNTTQKAIEDLVNDGLAIRIQGKGTFVPKSIVDFGLHRLSSFTEEMELKGVNPSSKVLRFERDKPPKEVANKLEIDEQDEAYSLVRIRYGDNNPMAYQQSYIIADLCEGIDKYDFSEESLFHVLESDYDLNISWQKQYVKPCIARKKEASFLEVELGTPLLNLEGVAYLERDVPFEYNNIYYRSDLYEFSIRSIRK